MLSSADCTLGVIPAVHGTPKHCLRGITAKAVPGSMLAAKRVLEFTPTPYTTKQQSLLPLASTSSGDDVPFMHLTTHT